MVKGFMRRFAQYGEGFYAWITLPDHRDLWINDSPGVTSGGTEHIKGLRLAGAV